MKRVRTERQMTPIGQEVEVEWFSGTPEEAEMKVREDGEIGLIKNGSHYGVNLENGDPSGLLQIWNETADEERPTKVSHLSEVFAGIIEFCGCLDV